MCCDEETCQDPAVLDMDEAMARQDQAEDMLARDHSGPPNLEQARRPLAASFNRDRIEELLALPTFTTTTNKRKRSATYAGHSKILTSAEWMAQAAAEERKREEKLAATQARKAAAAARRAAREERLAAAARDKPFGPNTAAEKQAAKSLWEKQDRELRVVLWPAAGEEEHPDRQALLARFRPLAHEPGMFSSPAAVEARARRFQQLKARRRMANVAATASSQGGQEGAQN